MTSFRPARRWLLLLLLYVAIDFMDPSIPGVFFFDTEFFFVDGVVQGKSNGFSNLAAADPTASWATVDYDDEVQSMNTQTFARAPARTHWKKLEHDDSASFGSVSPADSSPAPPSS